MHSIDSTSLSSNHFQRLSGCLARAGARVRALVGLGTALIAVLSWTPLHLLAEGVDPGDVAPGDLGPSDMVARWSFDDLVSGTVLDSSPQALHGVMRGTVTSVTGAPKLDGSGALELGGDALAEITDSGAGFPLDLLGGDGFSLVAWVRPLLFDGVQALISKDGAYELEIGHAGSNRYSLRLANSRRGLGATPLKLGFWHHVAAVWDGARLTYYLDGAADGDAVADVQLPANDRPVGLGGRPPSFPLGDDRHRLHGALDEVRVYDRPLAAEEVAQLAVAPPPDDTPPEDDPDGPGDSTDPTDPGGPDDPGFDLEPPVRSAAYPRGTLPAGTTTAVLTVATDEPAECRWSSVAGRSFDSQTGLLDRVAGATESGPDRHEATLTGLAPGTHRLSVRCRDAAGNTNDDDYAVAFFVDGPRTGFHPSAVPGVRFLVEARDGVSVATCDTETCRTAGDNVALDEQYCDLSTFPDGCVRRWRDASAYVPTLGFEPPEWTAGRDFGQDDVDKPGFVLDCLGSMPCIRGGVGALEDRTFEIEPGQEVDGIAGPFSIVVLARPVEQAGDAALFGFAGSLLLRKANGVHRLRIGFGDTVTVAPAGAIENDAWHLYELHRDADDRVRLVVDGVDVTPRRSDGLPPRASGELRFRFLLSVSRVNAFHGDVALALVADGGLDPSALDAVRSYVAETYGVP